MSWPLASVLAVWLALNVVASVVVLRNPFLPATKRLFQLALVWLFPVVGAVVCLAFISSEATERASVLDRTAFVDNADASGGPVAASPDPDIGGCLGANSGGDSGGSD